MASADRHGVRRQLLGTCALQPLQKFGCVGWLAGGHGVGGGLDSSLSNYQNASWWRSVPGGRDQGGAGEWWLGPGCSGWRKMDSWAIYEAVEV